MDIDDILQDINVRSLHRDPLADDDAGGGSNPRGGQADLQALTRAWVNERSTTELLAWPADDLIERCSGAIKSQISLVERLTGDMDPKTNFSLIIIQTEVERWKFLLRSLLRARLAKIDAHALHYMSTPELRERMCEMERAYATRHQALLHEHFVSSFLGAFPEQLRGLGDTAGGVSMVGGPDEDGAVFVRGLGGEEGQGVVVLGRGRDVDGEVEVQRGEIVVARWSDVREFVQRGEMELV